MSEPIDVCATCGAEVDPWGDSCAVCQAEVGAPEADEREWSPPFEVGEEGR